MMIKYLDSKWLNSFRLRCNTDDSINFERFTRHTRFQLNSMNHKSTSLILFCAP